MSYLLVNIIFRGILVDMNKRIIVSVVAIIIIAVLAYVGIVSPSSETQVIKIGVVAPLTGGGAAYGATLAKGVELAAADLVGKSTKYTYEVIVEDDTTNQATAASAANKLIAIDKVKAIITTTSSTGNAVKNIAEKAGVIHVCDCTDVTIGNVPYNFTNGMTPVDEVPVWLGEAQRRGVKTIAVLEQVHPGIKVITDEMVRIIPQYGIKIVYQDAFDGNVRDFKTIVSKAKASKPDLYYIGAFPPSLDIISKQFIDEGVKNLSTTALFAASPEPKLYEGLWYSDSMLADPAFADVFAQKNPTLRFNVRTAPYGYDIFNMLVQSFEKEGDAVTNFKAITSYDGKAGKVTKTPESSNFHTKASIWTIKDGKGVQI